MSTWSAFCGGMNTTSGGIVTNSVCVVSKIYSEIQGHSNDIIPSVFVGSGVDCSPGGNYCACPFRYEVSTGLPILYKTTEMCEYTLSGDNAAIGITAGTANTSIIANGLPNTAQLQCCGFVGLSHKYNAGDTPGTNFMTVLAYGNDGGSGVPCSSTSSCFGVDCEVCGVAINYTVPSPQNVVSVIQKTTSNTLSGWLNGTQLFSNVSATPCCTLNAGGSIHIGGGGDLSQPSMVAMREWAITNTAMNQSDVTAVFNQIRINFSGLGFVTPIIFVP